MPAMTNILVKDDAATPKEWTLKPVSDNPSPTWRSTDLTVPLIGQPRLSGSIEQQKNRDYKITAKLELPIMETLGTAGTSGGYQAPPAVAYVVPVIVTMFAPERSTVADRANALKMMIGMIQGATSTTDTGVLTNASSGDSWKNSSAPFPLLFTALQVPF